jgi:transposase
MKTVAQIGLDCHRLFSEASARDAQGELVWRERLEHEDREQLRRQLRRWPRGVPVVLEGTFGWGWISDELDQAGLRPHLASSKKVAAWREARGLAKSNRIDSDLLSELWSQQPRWWEVWLAPPTVRDQREWMRYRMGLVAAQTQLKNRIHAVLHRHGVVQPWSDLFGREGRAFLHELAGDVVRLRETARGVLAGHLRQLASLRGEIARATREIRRPLKRHVAAGRMRSLPGISWILAYTIVAEVGRIERFRRAKHLASYSLLAPRSYDSGDDDGEDPKGRHVGHAGRRTLKWAWIEAAHGAVRSGGRFLAIFDRITDEGRKNRNRGYITVAHELCRIAYALWTYDRDYSENRPTRPGSRPQNLEGKNLEGKKQRRKTDVRKPRITKRASGGRMESKPGATTRNGSRPGTGQPEFPMVDAVS